MEDPLTYTLDPDLDALEPVQIEELYREDDVPLGDVRERGLRVLLYAGLAVTALVILLGSTVELPRHLTVDFALKGDRQERVYQYFEPVYLEERYVQPGATVEAGAPLLRLTSPEIVALVSRYEAAAERLRIFDETQRPALGRQRAALRLEMDKLDAAAEAARRQQQAEASIYEQERDRLAFQAERAAERYERERSLLDKQLTSQDRVAELEEAYLAARTEATTFEERRRTEATALETRLREFDLEKAVLENRLAELENDEQTQRALLAAEVQTLAGRLERSYGTHAIDGNGLVLTAPFAGTVSFVTNADRDVAAGGIVLKLLQAPSETFAVASVPPRSIGRVAEGRPVVLKVATFPHYEWGVLRGRISHLSLTPDEHGLYPFEAEITDYGTLGPLLQIGMTGELSVEIERKSFFGYVFEGVQKAYYEATR